MEALGRMTAIILAIILIILFPIRYEARKTTISMNSYLNMELDHFQYLINEKKELTREMYIKFSDQLALTGESYQIEIDLFRGAIADVNGSEYFEYEDLVQELTRVDQIQLYRNDYITIRVKEGQRSFWGKLQNLFLPVFVDTSIWVTGGHLE